ncbi:MAG: type II/IV secretion system protein [SAR116 cluster bacterium]|nr:hypothetical protein [Paracoccaceae bacterium]RCL81200.1 MAG: type II/IV secretion system protein [SAR116 cluster bacterium]RPH14317.1 MAG: type II/IV secretion system protein [Alphaproteobacteria bacterium TMED150]HBP57732.1 hypothetical protein [Verrucomicrobiales bacterium]|tara:strand:+ start:12807 stop:14807 length:2001 start_codon:yes stop_codon:yes gene_type:complete
MSGSLAKGYLDFALEQGCITTEQFEHVLASNPNVHAALEFAIDRSVIDERRISACLAEMFRTKVYYEFPEKIEIHPEFNALFMAEQRIIPLKPTNLSCIAFVCDPEGFRSVDDVRTLTGMKVIPMSVTWTDFNRVLLSADPSFLDRVHSSESDPDSEEARSEHASEPLVDMKQIDQNTDNHVVAFGQAGSQSNWAAETSKDCQEMNASDDEFFRSISKSKDGTAKSDPSHLPSGNEAATLKTVSKTKQNIEKDDQKRGQPTKPSPLSKRSSRGSVNFKQSSDFVDGMLQLAVELGASDVHVEPYEAEKRLRLRLSGVLEEFSEFNAFLHKNYDPVIARLKIVAGKDIAERRLPQDGAFSYEVGKKQVDIRISFLPTKHGERVVMRILDKSGFDINIHKLGIPSKVKSLILRSIYQTQGIVLVTGPTGSGKSTTLYSALTELNTVERNILTCEDPVEYQLTGVGQVQVRDEIGLTFSSALRSFLRQDPEVILVGEIRDKETADIAIKASLTGHLVLSTLHTNDAVSTITRLINMDIPAYLISASIELVVAQRLVRKLCQTCRAIDDESDFDEAAEMLRIDPKKMPRSAWKPVGCGSCNNTGYSGRVGIYEALRPNDEFKTAIVDGASYAQLKDIALSDGFVTLQEHVAPLVEEGTTSLAECKRILSV